MGHHLNSALVRTEIHYLQVRNNQQILLNQNCIIQLVYKANNHRLPGRTKMHSYIVLDLAPPPAASTADPNKEVLDSALPAEVAQAQGDKYHEAE